MQNNIESAPLTEKFNLINFTDSLICDLTLLRAGKITTKDAMARAELAKQVLRSIGLVVQAQKYLSDQAAPAKAINHEKQG